ncbi:MAG: YciI family protein [Thermomicrobiales bacterium]
MKTFVVLSGPGPRRDLSQDARSQAYWDEHAAHIDHHVASGMIVMGGPLLDTQGALMVVQAEDEAVVRAMLDADPWYTHQILTLERVAPWQIFIDEPRR